MIVNIKLHATDSPHRRLCRERFQDIYRAVIDKTHLLVADDFDVRPTSTGMVIDLFHSVKTTTISAINTNPVSIHRYFNEYINALGFGKVYRIDVLPSSFEEFKRYPRDWWVFLGPRGPLLGMYTDEEEFDQIMLGDRTIWFEMLYLQLPATELLRETSDRLEAKLYDLGLRSTNAGLGYTVGLSWTVSGIRKQRHVDQVREVFLDHMLTEPAWAKFDVVNIGTNHPVLDVGFYTHTVLCRRPQES